MDTRSRWVAGAAGLLLLAAGCDTTTTTVARYSPAPEVPRPCAAAPAPVCDLPDGPLTLEQFTQIAVATHPDLRIAEAQAQVARGRMVQAGLYFNPVVGWQGTDIGGVPNEGGKQGPTLQQTIVTAHKLDIARQAGEHGVRAADWLAVNRSFDVRARLRAAYYEALAARREVQAADDLVMIAERALAAADKLRKAGTTGEPDVLRARVELEQLRNRRRVAQQRSDAARRLLLAAAGLRDQPERPLAGNLEDAPYAYEYGPTLAEVLQRSAEMQAAWASVAEAETLLARARVQPIPDVTVSLQPQYDFRLQRAVGQFAVSAPLPLFDRNTGNIRAAEAEAARTRAVVDQVELRLTERVARGYQRYQAAREQAEALEKNILPAARESLRLVLIGYEKGDPRSDYTTVQQAQVALAQVRLAQVQVLAELQAAISELEGLLQRGEGGPAACP